MRRRVLVTDGDRILQIVSNLIATRSRAGLRPRTVSLALGQRGDVVLSVSDTGPGIPPEQRERIFRPFWSGHGGHGGGTGLGLTIASELASALGGRLSGRGRAGRRREVRARPAGEAQPAYA